MLTPLPIHSKYCTDTVHLDVSFPLSQIAMSKLSREVCEGTGIIGSMQSNHNKGYRFIPNRYCHYNYVEPMSNVETIPFFMFENIHNTE